MSLARAEMAEQPAVLERLLRDPAITAAAEAIRARSPRYAVIAARGSSDNAARYAQHVFGRFWGLPVALATPSLHTLYDAPLRYDDALVIGISQSGASPDVASVVAAATEQGALTIAITNEPDSRLGTDARHVIDLQTGPERSVAATKTYTASLGAVAALVGDVSSVPDAMARQLDRDVPVPDWERLAVIGRGANYGTAFEAALKISELTGAVAVPYSSADFLHGPIAIVEQSFPVFLFGPPGVTWGSMKGMIEKLKEKRAETMIITDRSNAAAATAGDRSVVIPARLAHRGPLPVEVYTPIPYIIPAQLFAACLAPEKGLDPDRPRGLSKVTQTL